ncbi:methyltransferase domain-containing protein [Agaribacterium sp. ZY112]|uniref:methyltransferase domain-containing protein n=1 Tax=Agaribacterium sp. ZY112 TaxID=3233574 RepID=UPI00352589E6
MQFDSHSIDSPQQGLHPRLDDYLVKHLECPYQKPIQAHNLAAFEQFQTSIQAHGASSLILDSCCGTGLSTRALAKQHPDSLVIGVDRSIKRLNTQSLDAEALPANVLLLQANCEDIWRLCVQEKLSFDKHCILYPNPYPKSEHLKRRWHGHPVFPVLGQLAPITELRSNWPLYLEEFQHCWQKLKQGKTQLFELDVQEPLTLFERKYHLSGQKLYQLLCESSHEF